METGTILKCISKRSRIRRHTRIKSFSLTMGKVLGTRSKTTSTSSLRSSSAASGYFLTWLYLSTNYLFNLIHFDRIRKSLHLTLKRFEGKVGFWLDNLTRGDPLYPLLTEENLSALDRRLRIVLATVNHCKDTVQQHNVKHNPSQHKKLFY